MKRLVQWVVLSVALSGTAWAQESQPLTACRVPVDQWNFMSADQQAAACQAAGVVLPHTYEATVPGRKLAIAGVVTALAGVAVLGPWGQQYSILGDTFCVTDYAVYDGGCLARGKQALIGVGLIGGGITMAWLGVRRVSVNPTVTKHVKAVSAKVVW